MKEGRPHPYGGRCGPFPWPDNLKEIAVEDVKRTDFDVVLFQSRGAWVEDQHAILSADQRLLPRIYLEHDPPRESPTDTKHYVDDPDVLVVHVTHFNDLMWDSGRSPTRVIEHGVAVPTELRWRGDLERGLVVVNNLRTRGRRLGADVFARASQEVPLDLAGIGSNLVPGGRRGGLGDLPMAELWRKELRYRFLFNPIRYTSFGMAICEAMMLGLPIVALATTELPTVVEDGISGYLSNDVGLLIEHMRRLIEDPSEAAFLSEGARRTGRSRFDIRRFTRDWDDAFRLVSGTVGARPAMTARMTSPPPAASPAGS